MKIAFYKSTKSGIAGLYNRGVRIVTKGHYSHCEIIFSDGISASASFVDGGVRFKQIDYDPLKWDILELPEHLEANARLWFLAHEGDRYDILGNVHFLIPVVGDDKTKWCCSEACAQALGIDGAWRFHPNLLACLVKYMHNFKRP
jgi:hypothetical protein